jgi:hypothetical protein
MLKYVIIHIGANNDVISIQGPFGEGLFQVFHEGKAGGSVVITFVQVF